MTRAATVELRLNISFAQLKAGQAAIHAAAEGRYRDLDQRDRAVVLGRDFAEVEAGRSPLGDVGAQTRIPLPDEVGIVRRAAAGTAQWQIGIDRRILGIEPGLELGQAQRGIRLTGHDHIGQLLHGLSPLFADQVGNQADVRVDRFVDGREHIALHDAGR